MPVSEAKQKANTENAKKSTGPKTKIGKKRSAQNAVKHGLFSNSPVIEVLNEDKEEYEQLKLLMQIELRPKGVLQTHLVQKIVDSLWRYRRVINYEKSSIHKTGNTITPQDQAEFWAHIDDIRRAHYSTSPEEKHFYEERAKNRKSTQTTENTPLPSGADTLTFGRYESRLDRQLFRSIRMLRTLQRLQSSKPRKKRKK